MAKKDFFIGVILGIVLAFIGSFLFLKLFTSIEIDLALHYLKSNGNMGKVITLGALLNVGLVFLLFKKNKDMMAKGVIFSIFILTVFTLFV